MRDRRPSRWVVFWTVALILLAQLLASGELAAQNALERLVMPGPLVEGHAKLEKECTNCHSPFAPKEQDGRCLACHKPVAGDVKDKTGLHGKSPEVAANPCRHCHTDHKGRAADIVQFDRALFDHGNSDFALEGRHASVDCGACHAKGKKFREAPSVCVDCHRPANPHQGELTDRCERCHSARSWTELKPFDHDKTKFKLTGGHERTACRSCHAGERYKGLTTACADCHGRQDIHDGRNGTKCENCHTTKGWQSASFDHDVQTKFPLLGKHATTACEKCHKQDPRRVKTETACFACHEKDDPHKKQLGKQCLNCHGEQSWKKDVKFDHDLSRFPLRAKHAKAKCDSCHKTRAFKDAPVACSGCHDDKKTHDGRLGSNCGQCHADNAWKPARFDHDTATKFKLTGRHAKVACYACHQTRHLQKAKLPSDCHSCHKSRDRHRGAFGRNCGKCHTTSTFGTAYIRK